MASKVGRMTGSQQHFAECHMESSKISAMQRGCYVLGVHLHYSYSSDSEDISQLAQRFPWEPEELSLNP